MCIEYRTNGILPHPLPPEKKYDNNRSTEKRQVEIKKKSELYCY